MGAAADTRWWVKKAARIGMAAGGRAIARAEQTVSPGPRVRVLTYHRFGDAWPRDPFCVRLDVFEQHVAYLAERGLAVSLEDVGEFAMGRRSLPDGACLITMDDGSISMLTGALPILAKHGVRAVAYISAGLLGIDLPDLPERFMPPDALRELAQGMDIGSPSFEHVSVGRLSEARAKEEARRSKQRLEEIIGAKVRSFAYPFGTHGDFSDRTDEIMREAGYDLVFHSQHGAVRPGMLRPGGPLSLPRIKVEGGEPLWSFVAATRGAMDAWRLVDRNLWRFQRVRREINADEARPG